MPAGLLLIRSWEIDPWFSGISQITFINKHKDRIRYECTTPTLEKSKEHN